MLLSTLVLALFIFLQSASLLTWFAVSATFLGIVGLVFVVLVVLEALGVIAYSVRLPRRGQ